MDEIKLLPFNYLKANVKGEFEHKLAPCMAFVGGNRYGKTARLDAFRVALTGTHPVGPHGSNLMELTPEGAFSLRATISAAGPDGMLQESSYKVEMEGGKARKDDSPYRAGLLRALEDRPDAKEIFANMLPATSMRDLIKLGSTLGREALFRRFGECTTMPVPRGLDEAQKKLWDEGVASAREAKPKADTAEILAAASAWFRQKKLALGRELKALKQLVEERETKLTPELAGVEMLKDLRTQLEQARAWEGAAGLRQAKAKLEQEIQSYREKIAPHLAADKPEAKAAREAEYNSAVEAKKANIAALEAESAQLAEKLREVEAAYAERIRKEVFYLTGGEWLEECIRILEPKVDAEGKAACLLCGGPADVQALKATIAPRVQARRASLAAIEEAATKAKDEVAQRRAKAEELARRARDEFQSWDGAQRMAAQAAEAEKNALRQEGNRLKGALEQNTLGLANVPASYDGLSSVDLQMRITALEEAETLARNLDAEMLRIRELTIAQDVAKTLELEASKAVAGLLARTAELANASVNKYMPEGFRAVVDLEKAQWTVVGADNRPHDKRVMAGSEMGALMVALALAWTEGAPGRYLLLDDEDLAYFDPQNLRRLLVALEEAVHDGLLTQVIVAWSRPDEVPDSWLKVFVDRPETELPLPATSRPATDALVGGPQLLL